MHGRVRPVQAVALALSEVHASDAFLPAPRLEPRNQGQGSPEPSRYPGPRPAEFFPDLLGQDPTYVRSMPWGTPRAGYHSVVPSQAGRTPARIWKGSVIEGSTGNSGSRASSAVPLNRGWTDIRECSSAGLAEIVPRLFVLPRSPGLSNCHLSPRIVVSRFWPSEAPHHAGWASEGV